MNSSLKDMIARGKQQGFLAYEEVKEHLPKTIIDQEQIDDIVAMIEDMGVRVTKPE